MNIKNRDMYRVVEMSGKYYAVKIDDLEDGDERANIETFVNEGLDVILTDDYEQYDAELVIPD